MNNTIKCPYCCEEIPASSTVCPYCGESLGHIQEEIPTQGESSPEPEMPELAPKPDQTPSVSNSKSTAYTVSNFEESNSLKGLFIDPIFKGFFDFKGKLNRKQFLAATVTIIIVMVILGGFAAYAKKLSEASLSNPWSVVSDALIILMTIFSYLQTAKISVRRTNDIGISPYWNLLYIGFGFIPFLMCLFMNTGCGSNKKAGCGNNQKTRNDSRKKTGKIAVIAIVCLVLLGGGSGACWYYISQLKQQEEYQRELIYKNIPTYFWKSIAVGAVNKRVSEVENEVFKWFDIRYVDPSDYDRYYVTNSQDEKIFLYRNYKSDFEESVSNCLNSYFRAPYDLKKYNCSYNDYAEIEWMFRAVCDTYNRDFFCDMVSADIWGCEADGPRYYRAADFLVGNVLCNTPMPKVVATNYISKDKMWSVDLDNGVSCYVRFSKRDDGTTDIRCSNNGYDFKATGIVIGVNGEN